MTLLLQFAVTYYELKQHYIEKLSKQVRVCTHAYSRFSPHVGERKRLFESLQEAYTDARYNPKYKITKKQVAYLAGRVRELQRLTKEVCKQRLGSFV